MSKKLNKAFGNALREARKKRKLSQLVVSTKSGVDRTYMSELERGLKNPSLDTICRLAKAIGIAPAELVGRTTDYLA